MMKIITAYVALATLSTSTTLGQNCDIVESSMLDGAEVNSFLFGIGLEYTDDLIAVGGPLASSPRAAFTGVVSLFEPGVDGWSSAGMLYASNGSRDDRFGETIERQGNTIVVGAPSRRITQNREGAAYIFERVDGEWEQTRFLRTDFGIPDNQFGRWIQFSDDGLYIAAKVDTENGSQSGAVYVYTYNDDRWVFDHKIRSSDQGSYRFFGAGLTISGDTLVASGHGESATDQHRLYVFGRDMSHEWVEMQKLDAPESLDTGSRFGYEIAVSENVILTSDILYSSLYPGSQNGAVFVYRKSGGVWAYESAIFPDAPVAQQLFGKSLAISGDGNTVFVGCEAGSGNRVYEFSYGDGQWSEVQQITAMDTQSGDHLGNSLELADGKLIVGAFGAGLAGRTYLFDVNCDTVSCTPDLTGDGVLDFFDVSAFLSAYSAQDPAADFTADGQYDFFDVSAFLSAFSAGCP